MSAVIAIECARMYMRERVLIFYANVSPYVGMVWYVGTCSNDDVNYFVLKFVGFERSKERYCLCKSVY